MPVLFRLLDPRPTLFPRAMRAAIVLFAVAALLTGCGDDDDPDSEPALPEATAEAPTGQAVTETATEVPEAAPTPSPDTAPTEVAAAETATEVPEEPEEAPSPPPRGGTLTFGLVGAPPTMNPGIGDPAFNSFYPWAYDSLLILQPDGTFVPNLAVEFGYTDDRNMRYELTLREGVRFSDGTQLDAQAVKTHIDYVRSQPSALAQLFANVVNVEVTGPLTLAVELGQPDPGLNFNFAQGFGGGNIISPAAIESPETLDFGTAGAGPYMFIPEDSVVNDTYVFTPNPHYWNPDRIHWDKVVLKVIPNSSSMIEAIRAGQVQAGHGDAATMAAAVDAGINVTFAPQILTGINLADRNGEVSAALGDVRVRRALNHAVDRKAVAAAIFGDEGLALSQYAIEGQRGYDPALDEANAYNPDLARQLLEEAGYGDGVSIGVLTIGILNLDTLVEAVAGQLEEVGVTLDVTTVPDPTSYFVGMTSKEHPSIVLGYGISNMQTLHVGFINPLGPFNPFGTVDGELDSLYEEYFATVGDTSDVERRINARLVEQAWVLPVMGSPLVWYFAEGLTGIEATGGNSAIPTFVDLRIQ